MWFCFIVIRQLLYCFLCIFHLCRTESYHTHTSWSNTRNTVRNQRLEFYFTASSNINSSLAPTTFDHSTPAIIKCTYLVSSFFRHFHRISFRTILFGLRLFINLIPKKKLNEKNIVNDLVGSEIYSIGPQLPSHFYGSISSFRFPHGLASTVQFHVNIHLTNHYRWPLSFYPFSFDRKKKRTKRHVKFDINLKWGMRAAFAFDFCIENQTLRCDACVAQV